MLVGFFSPLSHHESIIICMQSNVADNWRNFNIGTILFRWQLVSKLVLFSVLIARNWSCCKENLSLSFFFLFCVFLLSKANNFKLISLIHILMDKCVKIARSECGRTCVLRRSLFIYVLISFLYLFMVSMLHHPCHTSLETELNFSPLMVLSSEISLKCISLVGFLIPAGCITTQSV